MSEIICPHCGTSNSIVALECSACHKSLYDEPSQPFQNPEDDEMEWLKNYRSFGEDSDFSAAQEKAEEPEAEPKSEPEIPDWLARIRARNREESLIPADEAQTPGENVENEGAEPLVPEWLKGLKDGDDEPEVAAEESNEFPDWLSRLAALKAEDASAGGEGISPSFIEPVEFIENTPDLPSIQDANDEGLGFLREELESEELLTPDLPRSDEQFDSSPLIFEPFDNLPPEPDEETEQTPSISEEFSTDAIEIPTPQEGLPTFLFKDLEDTDKSLEIEGFEPVDEIPSLDWLYDSPEKIQPAEENLSEGLANLDWEKIEGEVAGSQRNNEPAPTNLPDWLFDQGEDLSDQEIKQDIFGSSDLEGANPIFKGGQEKPLYDEESLPEWLKSPQPVDESSESLEPSQPEIESVGMPGWLEAMRPVENAGPRKIATQADNRIEASGPLAGYQGVLPGEKAVTHYSKPPVYGSRMVVTDKQRIYATLFDTLIAEEKQADARIVEKTTLPPQTLRLVVGLITIGILIMALLFNANAAILPELYPPENVAFFSKIQELTGNSEPRRILVGMDYEPALSGELSSMSTTVMEDLISSNSTLIFVSINPSGPALSADLITRANGIENENFSPEQVINLGYLPGGASALAGLALAPRLAAPVSVDGAPAWDNPIVAGINSMADFDAILLLTDNTDSSRSWIEQITPTASQTPFLLIASAQAAPALQPYVQSGQVAGMLAGFSGSTAYQQLALKSSGTVDRYWDAYQVGMLLAAALMLIGAIIFGVLGLVTHFKKA